MKKVYLYILSTSVMYTLLHICNISFAFFWKRFDPGKSRRLISENPGKIRDKISHDCIRVSTHSEYLLTIFFSNYKMYIVRSITIVLNINAELPKQAKPMVGFSHICIPSMRAHDKFEAPYLISDYC